MVSTSRGILKYSTEWARAKELGGISTESFCTVTKEFSSNFLGSTMAEFTLVKIQQRLEVTLLWRIYALHPMTTVTSETVCRHAVDGSPAFLQSPSAPHQLFRW